MKKNLSILGSTGSIGVNALDVVSRSNGEIVISALAAGRNIALLREQIMRFRPPVVSVLAREDAEQLQELLGSDRTVKILWGEQGYREVAAESDADMVLSAMVGAAGLLPTWEAIRKGKHIALANKETLVTAGPIIMEEIRRRGIRLFPVDSEHSAIFQCLDGQKREHLQRIILTASGGPFLHRPKESFDSIRIEDALKHPNWKMGKKITIDSASMMNKGLEVIEARWLFDVNFDRIDVCVHPQSVIHSMVEFMDGSILAQMGVPDMRIPISYALCYPQRLTMSPEAHLDFRTVSALTFMAPDVDRFPNLALAYEAGRKGGGMPTVMNAANEIAVERFINGAISFTDMSVLIKKTMTKYQEILLHEKVLRSETIEDILRIDQWARRCADEFSQGMEHDGQ